ncbi:MAG: hypothetical protein ABI947_03700 [Chloroflexota bacterium]
MVQSFKLNRQYYLLLATIILLLATFLRIADLHRYPPGMHYDEAADMILSRDVGLLGSRPFPVITAYTGKEVLFYYLAAPLVNIVGGNIFATRLTSAFVGILAIAATLALGKVMFRDDRIALLAGAWFAVSGPDVWLSRQGFRTSPQPLFEALALWLLWIALRRTRHWLIPAILAGIFGGLTLYIYIAARIFPPWLLIPLGLLILVDRGTRWLRLKQVAVFFAALAVTALPIVIFYATNLHILTDRLSQLAPTSDTPTLWQSVVLHLKMFFIAGDPVLRYNLDFGRPYFDPISGVLLVIGLILAGWMLFRRSAPLEKTGAAFLLFCPLLILPSVLAVQGFPPSHMRSVSMVPLIFFPSAVAIVWSVQRLRIRYLWPVVAVFLLIIGGITWRDYQVWGARTDVFYENDGDLNLAAQSLEKTAAPNELMYIGSKYYEHPTVLAYNLNPGLIRWMVVGQLITPPPDREAIYIFPRSVESKAWTHWLAPGRVSDIAEGPDGSPAYQAFHFAAGTFPMPTPSIPLDVNFGGIVRLRGADLPSAVSGKMAEATLYWEVLRTPDRDDLATAIHLVDAWGNEVTVPGNQDFDYTSRWLPGEWIVQRLTYSIPVGTPPGNYILSAHWVGKARQNDYLSVLDSAGRFAGIQAEIKPLVVSVGAPRQIATAESEAILPGIYATLAENNTTLPTQILQGTVLPFTISWQVAQPITSDKPLQVTAQPIDGGKPSVLWTGQPVHDTYPMTQWHAGELITDHYAVPIPPNLPAGKYQISLTVDGGLRPVFSHEVEIVAVNRNFSVPTLSTMTEYRFGDAIKLVGYEVTKPANGQVTVKLAWQASAKPDRDYTVFVHLLKPDGTIFSQQDKPPTRPTSQWIAQEVNVESYTLPTPPGDYRIVVGLYLQENGLRLSVRDKTDMILGDTLALDVAK